MPFRNLQQLMLVRPVLALGHERHHTWKKHFYAFIHLFSQQNQTQVWARAACSFGILMIPSPSLSSPPSGTSFWSPYIRHREHAWHTKETCMVEQGKKLAEEYGIKFFETSG